MKRERLPERCFLEKIIEVKNPEGNKWGVDGRLNEFKDFPGFSVK